MSLQLSPGQAEQPPRTIGLSVKDMAGTVVPFSSLAGEARENIMARIRERARIVDVDFDPGNLFIYVTVRIGMDFGCAIGLNLNSGKELKFITINPKP